MQIVRRGAAGMVVGLLAGLLVGCETPPPMERPALEPRPGLAKSMFVPPRETAAAGTVSESSSSGGTGSGIAGEWSPQVGRLLDAMEQVESGGRESATSRDGKSIGPLQIQQGYWKDSRVPGSFSDCRQRDYARRVVYHYWMRYCPKALAAEDLETLARTHNGGPRGAQQGWTRAFWQRVQAMLERTS